MATEARNATTLQVAGNWTNETNFIGAHDGNCMTVASKDEVSGEFSFNFSTILDGSVINGIEVLLHCIADDADDYLGVELKDSTDTWRRKDTSAPGSGADCAACVDKTVGGASDLWGGTWTVAHFKSTNFRIRIESEASGKAGAAWRADYCLVTIHYTPPTVNTYTKDFGVDTRLVDVNTYYFHKEETNGIDSYEDLKTNPVCETVKLKSIDVYFETGHKKFDDWITPPLKAGFFPAQRINCYLYGMTDDGTVDLYIKVFRRHDSTETEITVATGLKQMTTYISEHKVWATISGFTANDGDRIKIEVWGWVKVTGGSPFDTAKFYCDTSAYSSRAILRAYPHILTATYLTDTLFMKLGITKTYGVDTILSQAFATYTRTFGIDALLKKKDITKAVDLDTLLKAIDITKTYGTDVLMKFVLTREVDVDALLKKLDVMKTYGVDSKFITQITSYTKTYGADALIKALDTVLTYDVDALLRDTFTLAYDVDALFLKIGLKTYTADAILKLVASKEYGADILLRDTYTRLYEINTLLKKADLTRVLNIDTIFKLIETKDYSADAILKKLGALKTYSSDVLLKKSDIERYFSVDALLRDTMTKGYDVDTILVSVLLKTYVADTLLKQLDSTKSYSIDVILAIVENILEYAVDTILKKIGSKEYLIDAFLTKLGIKKAYGTDVFLTLKDYAKSYAIDMLLELAVTKTYVIDALLKQFNITRSVDIDAILVNVFGRTYSTDTLLKALDTLRVYDADTLLKKLDVSKSYDVDLLIVTVLTRAYGADALLKWAATKAYDLDVILAKAFKKLYSIDTLLRVTSIKDYYADALLKGALTRTVSIDVVIESIEVPHMKLYKVDLVIGYIILPPESMGVLTPKDRLIGTLRIMSESRDFDPNDFQPGAFETGATYESILTAKGALVGVLRSPGWKGELVETA